MNGENIVILTRVEGIRSNKHEFQLDELVERIKANYQKLVAHKFQKDLKCKPWK